MSLPALDDIVSHTGTTDPIDGVVRIETAPLEETAGMFFGEMRSVYSHDDVFGQYCTVNEYVDCPPDELFKYLSDTRSLEEWTYTRTFANSQARTVDYHCAWDQGKHLWMIYLMRVLDAQVVLNKPGSVVLWTNCRHPFYDENPYPDAAPEQRTGWVGDFWDLFGAGHKLELNNLKCIAEYRHHNGLPVTPAWMR